MFYNILYKIVHIVSKLKCEGVVPWSSVKIFNVLIIKYNC